VGSFQPRDPKTHDLGDAFVEVGAQRIVAQRPGQVVVSPDEQQRGLVSGRQRVEVLGLQVPATEEEVDRAEPGDRPLVEELRILFVADSQKPASRYSSSLNNGVTSRWKAGRSTRG
jgi:hypothetical protein